MLAKLKEVLEEKGAPLEEIILEAVYKHVGLSDFEARTGLHLKLCEKYLHDASYLLSKKDYMQAGEKLWGAAAQIVKAVAAKKGIKLDTHAKLWDFVAELRVKLGDPEIGRLWSSASSLHKNFYKAQVRPELVEDYTQDVERLVENLESLSEALKMAFYLLSSDGWRL